LGIRQKIAMSTVCVGPPAAKTIRPEVTDLRDDRFRTGQAAPRP
jgi:hypothetical protein